MTKEYIIDSAFRLLENCDYQKLKVKDIIEAANCSKNTFYSFFSSKQNVFEEALQIILAESYSKVEESNKELISYSKKPNYEEFSDNYLKFVIAILEVFETKKQRLKLLLKLDDEFKVKDKLHANTLANFRKKTCPETNYFIVDDFVETYLYFASSGVMNVMIAWCEGTHKIKEINKLADYITYLMYTSFGALYTYSETISETAENN